MERFDFHQSHVCVQSPDSNSIFIENNDQQQNKLFFFSSSRQELVLSHFRILRTIFSCQIIVNYEGLFVTDNHQSSTGLVFAFEQG